MAQADGTNKTKRMSIKDPKTNKTFNFALNPQEYKVNRPQRVTVIKTMSDIVIEDFNSDIPTLTISGHTGWQNGKGKERFDALKSLLADYADNTINYGTLTQEPLYFYNYTDEEYFRVHLHQDGYNFSRSVSNPLLYEYEINFYIVSNTDSYKNPSSDLVQSEEISTKDKNAQGGIDGSNNSSNSSSASSSKEKNPYTSVDTSTSSNGTSNTNYNNAPSNTGSNKPSSVTTTTVIKKNTIEINTTNAPPNIDSNVGYDGATTLGATNTGSTRLKTNTGVQ